MRTHERKYRRVMNRMLFRSSRLPNKAAYFRWVMAEAAAVEEAGLEGGTTPLPFITIDPADARDHDDAVFAEPVPTIRALSSGWRLPCCGLCRRRQRNGLGLKRGNRFICPTVVPMLPEQLSNDLCFARKPDAPLHGG